MLPYGIAMLYKKICLKLKKKMFKTELDCSAQRFLRATKYTGTASMYIL